MHTASKVHLPNLDFETKRSLELLNILAEHLRIAITEVLKQLL